MQTQKQTKTKWYWTKPRKTQFLYWKILAANFFLAVSIIGLFQTYTERHINKMSEFSLVSPVKAEVVEPETVEEQIRRIAKEENFQWADWLVKIADCESKLNPLAVNGKGNKPVGSVDRGLYMINDYWHKEISNECTFSVDCSTRFAIKLTMSGRQKEFVCNQVIKIK